MEPGMSMDPEKHGRHDVVMVLNWKKMLGK